MTSKRRILFGLGLVLALCATSANAFEQPSGVGTASVLGAAAKGPGYVLAPKAGGDGLMRTFTLTTRGQTLDITGEAFLRVRLREIAALEKLDSMSRSEVFIKSVGEAAAAPLRFGAELVTSPAETLKRSAAGVGNMVDRIGSAVSNRTVSRDGPVTSLLGVDAARRALAVELGVDPYTDFAPLADALARISKASAAGGLSVKALTLAIPGGAGLVVSSTGTADTVKNTLREKTSTQIVEQVRATLSTLGVQGSLSDALISNRHYTPTDLLVIADALKSMRLKGSDIFVRNAVGAGSREDAFYATLRVSLLSRHARNYKLESFIDAGPVALNRMADGGVVALLPVDHIAWTQRNARMFEAIQKQIDAVQPRAAGRLLLTTGDMTAMAKKEFAARKWTHARLARP